MCSSEGLEGITEAMQTGKRCKHTAVRLHREGKKAITALNLSRLYIYCRTLFLNADFSRLCRTLRAYWLANRLDGGVYPENMVIQVGSRV